MEWRWEQVAKQCEKHEGEKQQTPARETQPGPSITFQQSSANWAAQTAAGRGGYTRSPTLNYSADSVAVCEE